jgi:APA family basic amino acid/polyamine antiporter
MTGAGGKRPAGGLHRVIRVRDGLAVTVGMVIGAGILRTPGLIAGYIGDAWTILGVWLLGGIVAGLSTLLLAEMSAALPSAGGKYVYAKAAFGPLAGFVAGWSELVVTRAFSGAAKAVVVAEYATSLAGRGSVPGFAGVVVLGFLLLHMGGLKAGTRFQNVTTIVKILVLLGIAAAGLMSGDARGFTEPLRVAPEYAGLLGFALAYQAVAFAYYGWEDAAKLAEEVKDPGRALPKILLGGAAAVAAVYLLINVAFLFALTPGQMNGSPLVAQDAIAGVLGPAAGKVIVVAGLLILLSSINVNFLGMPRVAFALARDRLAPAVFTRVGRRGTPTAALFFISVLILGLAISGAFEFLIRFMMLIAISIDLMVLLAFFRLRRARPDLVRPMRVPGYPWLPALAILLYLMVLAIIISTQPALALGGGAMLLLFIGAGALTVRKR